MIRVIPRNQDVETNDVLIEATLLKEGNQSLPQRQISSTKSIVHAKQEESKIETDSDSESSTSDSSESKSSADSSSESASATSIPSSSSSEEESDESTDSKYDKPTPVKASQQPVHHDIKIPSSLNKGKRKVVEKMLNIPASHYHFDPDSDYDPNEVIVNPKTGKPFQVIIEKD